MNAPEGPPPSEPDRRGQVHAGCLVDRLLGRGGMGSVYLARRQADGLPVVVKFLAPDMARDPALRARFQREWEALRRIRPHPHVVRIHTIEAAGEAPCIVMEYVEGRSLKDALQEHGRLAPEQVARWGREIALGLAAVHAHGLIHRDVKPDNVIVNRAGQAKIVDFGLAKDLFLSALTQPGQLLGTALYMAPEQWEDEGVDARCDIFALGATLYHLLVGRPPFVGGDVDAIADAVMAGDYPPPSSLYPDVPRALEFVLAQMMMGELRYRYARAEACAEDLERVLRGEPPHVPFLAGGDGVRHPLLPGEWFTLGSDPQSAIPLAHPSVAKKHAQVRRQPEGFVLRGLRSKTGTFVNDETLPKRRARPLRDGDRIRVGEVELLLSDPRGREEAVAPYLRDVQRSEQPAPAVETLAAGRDPGCALALLERLAPDRYADGRDDRVVARLLGDEVARRVAAERARRQAQEAAGLPRLLAHITGAGAPEPLAWLAWWHQVRLTAPPQVGPAAPPRELRLQLAEPGAEDELELPLQEQSVLLVGRDPKCQLRLSQPAAPRLQATILRLHRRLIVLAEAGEPPLLNGAPLRWGYLDPGDRLSLSGATLALEATDPGPPAPVGPGFIPIEPATFWALEALRHPAVAAAEVGFLHEPGERGWPEACARSLFPEASAARAFAEALTRTLHERAAIARQLLPALLGGDAGPDPAAWTRLLESRRAQLPPQLVPRGWLRITR